MRRPRDIDLELQTLEAKAKQLRLRRVAQLGELVIGCAADALPIEMLAGALLEAAATKDAAKREAWRINGAGFFRAGRKTSGSAAGDQRGAAPPRSAATPPAGRAGAS